MKKWAICLALVMVIAMIFTGCGETPVEETDGTTTTTTTASKADVTIKGGKTTVANGNNDAGNNDAGNNDAGNNDADSNEDSATNKPGAANKPGKATTKVDDKYTGNNAMGEVTIQKVETKAYTIAAKGSKYASGIKLPKLSKTQAKVSYMTNTDWKYIQTESTEEAPTAIYHSMLVWKEVYGVDVEIEMVDWDNFTSYLITSVVAGEGPDVMRWVSGRPKWINNNLVTSLEDKLDLTDPDYAVDYMQENAALYGHLYAAWSQPLDQPGSGIAYNKTKFEQAGVEDPMSLYKKGKWTFSQFIKTAKQMTDEANNEYGVAGSGTFYPTHFCMMYLNDDATVTLRVKDAEFVKCMQAVWKLYRVENAARRTDEYRDTFPKGQDAMAPCGATEYARMMDTAKRAGTTDEFGFVPMPAYDMIGWKNPIGSNGRYMDSFSISSVPKNLEGAVEFVRLVTKVGTNIAKASGKWGWVKTYLSDEEKDVFSKVKYTKFKHSDCTNSIDGTNTPMNSVLKYPIYLNATSTQELSTILANAYSTFSGVIKEYEINAGLRK